MRTQKRRKHSPAFKAKVALSAIEESNTLAELVKKFEVSGVMISRWKKEFLENASVVFSKKSEPKSSSVDTQKLYAQIGELKVGNDFLKKKLRETGDMKDRKQLVEANVTNGWRLLSQIRKISIFMNKTTAHQSVRQQPLVSVITVVFNGEQFLERTLSSVIKQTYPNIEYIIIDGGSTDKTIDIIRKYEDKIAHWVSEKDNGIYDAMNKGIKRAKGKWINFMNAGDYYYDHNVLEKISNLFIRQNEGIIYGKTIVYQNNKPIKNKPIKNFAFTKLNLLLLGTGVLCHQAMFVNKNTIIPYSDKYLLKGELDWYFNLLNNSKFYTKLKLPVVYYLAGGIGVQQSRLNTKEKFQLLWDRYLIIGILLALPMHLYYKIKQQYSRHFD